MPHCTRGRFAVLVSLSGELAVYSCSLLRMQMRVAKACERIVRSLLFIA